MKTSAARWGNDSKGLYIAFYNNNAEEIRQTLAMLEDGKQYDIELKEHKKKRSLDANAYAWVLMGKLAEATEQCNTDVYKTFIREIGGNYDTLCMLDKAVARFCQTWQKNGIGWVTETMPSKLPNCTTVLAYYGSSTFDSRQMSKFTELIIDECKQYNIETKTPAEMSLLLEEWHQ